MGPSRSVMLRPRSLARVLCAALAWGCSIYDLPAPRGDLTGSGGGGSTGGGGGAGGEGGLGTAGSSGAAASGGAGGHPDDGGSGGQAGNGSGASSGAGGAGNSGGSTGVGGLGGFSGGGGKQDDGGSADGSGGVPPGTDGGSSGGTDGGSSGGTAGSSGGTGDGSSGGAVDSVDAQQDRDAQDSADGNVDACTPESDATFCQRVGKNCGVANGINNCGSAIAPNCGSCTTPQTCGGAGQPNVCGSPTNVAKGGTVTASSPGVSPEDMTKAFDENSATKWYAGDDVNVGWIAYQFAAGVTRTVTSYAITSANDRPARDPATWQLQGSNDGQNWTLVDSRTGESFATRLLTKTYSCASPMAYGRYRLNITANAGELALQLAELQLLGY